MHASTADHQSEPIALRLAHLIHDFKQSQVTPKALKAARTAIIDTIGVTLAGSAEPCTKILLETPGVGDGPGEATVFGTRHKTSALDASFINGTASHALDYDDFSSIMGGHHSVPLVSPLLAVAEEKHLSGEALIRAYVVGIETEIRIARAVNFHHYDKGWHPTATLGVFGTVAAVSHLIGLDVDKIAIALGLAASLASGVKANFGTMTKPLHVGHSSRSGLLAVLLAERGFTANPLAIEHKQGFLNAFNGVGNFDASRIFADWAAPLEIESALMGLKQFPCCGSTHPAVSMALLLVHEEHVNADDIESIHIQSHMRRLPHTDNPNPQTSLAAKFSVQYAVARALLDGTLRLSHFEGDAHHEPRILDLLKITRTNAHPDMPEDSPHQFGAEVSLTLRDGRTVTRRVDDMIGRGGDNPLSADELWEKFNDCSKRALAPTEVMPLYERLESLETVADISQITRLLASRSLPGNPTAGAKTFAPAPGNTLAETWVP